MDNYICVASFFSDFTGIFNGRSFFEMSGFIWNDLMKFAKTLVTGNLTKGDYSDTWKKIKEIYDLFPVLTSVLFVLFFLYGFCRECTDIHSDMTMDRSIKMFLRLIITANLLATVMSWLPDIFSWGGKISHAVLGKSTFGFSFDGAKIYERISSADFGTMTAFVTSMMFFFLTAVCAFMILQPLLTRIVKIYMLVPFSGLALSTLPAGGQPAQTGFSYIKTVLGLVLQTALISVVIVISSSFIEMIALESDNAIVIVAEYALKMTTLAAAVRGAEPLMQKAFSL